MDTMDNERRVVERTAMQCNIEYSFPGQAKIYQGRCVDFSEKGLSFEAEYPIPLNTALQVSLLSENTVISTLHTLVKIIDQHQQDSGLFVSHAEIKAIKA